MAHGPTLFFLKKVSHYLLILQHILRSRMQSESCSGCATSHLRCLCQHAEKKNARPASKLKLSEVSIAVLAAAQLFRTENTGYTFL